MDVFETIYARRAVKYFDPDFVMPEADLDRLKEAARQTPTSFNIQNWRAVLVRDPGVKAQLRAAAWDQAQVSEASVVVVLCCDLRAHEKDPARYWAEAPPEAQAVLVPMIGSFYAGRDWIVRDEGMRSVGLVAQTIMLAAKGMGYDSCPMIGFDQDQVAQLIHLPSDHALGMLIPIGKALRPARPKGGYLPSSEMFPENQFGS